LPGGVDIKASVRKFVGLLGDATEVVVGVAGGVAIGVGERELCMAFPELLFSWTGELPYDQPTGAPIGALIAARG